MVLQWPQGLYSRGGLHAGALAFERAVGKGLDKSMPQS